MTLGTITNQKLKTANIAETVQKAREAFNRGVTKPIEWRRKQLKNILRMYEENKNGMVKALAQDLRRSKMEAILLEVDYLINDLKSMLHHLDEWVAPTYPGKGLVNILDDVVVYNDPYGVVLVIGAWNYPLQLLLLPMAGAISAGNAVIIKPSEVSEACAQWVVETLPKYVDNDAIFVVEGGPEETSYLLKQKFDYIFYTGSTNVGRLVYKAATDNLTPVTLELGGKSPVYVDNTADLEVTAKRILWGKFINAGQTCIAPDYVLCTKEIQDKLVEHFRKILKEWYGDEPQKSPDLCRIVNGRHFSRLQALVDTSKSKIVIGGNYDPADNFIEPTVVANVTGLDKLMDDEIFGPILPIVPVENAFEAIKFINEREHPLVLYLFTRQTSVQELFRDQTRSGTLSVNDTILFYSEKPLTLYIFSTDSATHRNFLDNTTSGSVCVNDTVMQMGVETLPFGGVGNSGMGAYHGKATFDTFTHKKSCLVKNFAAIGEKLASGRYPPYSEAKLNYITGLMRKRHGPSFKFLPYLIAFGLGAGLSYAATVWYKMTMEENM